MITYNEPFDHVVTSLTTYIDNTSMVDFQAHLLGFESRPQNQRAVDPINPSSNVAPKSSSRASSSSSSTRGRHSRNGSQPPSGPCQLCRRRNHMAASC